MATFMTLLVEDDVFQREVLADVLRGDGFEVLECSTAEAAELVVATSGTELRYAQSLPIRTCKGRCSVPSWPHSRGANSRSST
jgi:hypothetical protein